MSFKKHYCLKTTKLLKHLYSIPLWYSTTIVQGLGPAPVRFFNDRRSRSMNEQRTTGVCQFVTFTTQISSTVDESGAEFFAAAL